jgi:TPR repeat protein
MQIEGRGLPRNPEQGLGLLRRAVAAGSALATQDLANLYLRGAPGIPKDPAESVRSMAASARLGNAAAMLELGSLYFQLSRSEDGRLGQGLSLAYARSTRRRSGRPGNTERRVG